MALLGGGGYAEYVSCPEFHAINKPKNLDWVESASIPEVYATCWLNLFMEASMTKGEKVVFHAGASGIGTAGIQLAKAFGCESFVTAGSEDKIKKCIDLGASDGEVRSKDIFSKIQSWAPEGVHIILDPVGAEYFENNLGVLGIEGRLIIIGLMGGIETKVNLGHLMIKRQKIIGSTIRALIVEPIIFCLLIIKCPKLTLVSIPPIKPIMINRPSIPSTPRLFSKYSAPTGSRMI